MLSRPDLRQAALALDLESCRRLVHVGADGELLAAFLDAWPQLSGDWLVAAEAEPAARQFLHPRGLDGRMRCLSTDSLATVPAADLVVLSAIDEAVEHSLQLLVSASRGWLPAGSRWLILQRASPHLSCVIDAPLLQAQGLRVASRWPLSAEVQMLVCAPAFRFVELLAAGAAPGPRGDRPAAHSPAP